MNNLLEHTHHWRPLYVPTEDNPNSHSFVGLACDCGLMLAPDDLADLVNRSPNNILIIQHAIRKPGPSETKDAHNR
jgi:hypothetical protein